MQDSIADVTCKSNFVFNAKPDWVPDPDPVPVPVPVPVAVPVNDGCIVVVALLYVKMIIKQSICCNCRIRGDFGLYLFNFIVKTVGYFCINCVDCLVSPIDSQTTEIRVRARKKLCVSGSVCSPILWRRRQRSSVCSPILGVGLSVCLYFCLSAFSTPL